MYRRAPEGFTAVFEAAADAYAQVRAVLEEQGDGFIEAYRFSPKRTSSIAIEVRKDIACALGADGMPTHVHAEHVNRVADRIAEAVVIYLEEDMEADVEIDPEIERHGPWYMRPEGGS